MSFYTWIATPLARNDDDTIPRKCNLCGDLLTANDTPLRPVSFAGSKSPHFIDLLCRKQKIFPQIVFLGIVPSSLRAKRGNPRIK